MFDTIVLILLGKELIKGNPHTVRAIAEYNPIHPYSNKNGYFAKSITTTSTKTAREKNLNVYRVRVDEVQPKGRPTRVKVQFSAPKLLFGSNLFEIQNTNENREKLIDKLYQQLKYKVKNLSKKDVKNATVYRIDFCKNIVFQPNIDINWFIKTISTYRFDPRYKITNRNFDSEKGARTGSVCTFFNTQQAFKFYDKTEEILNNKKPTNTERELISTLSRQNPRILRIERVLQTQAATKRFLSKLLKTDQTKFTLKDVFNADLAKSVLQNPINDLVENNLNIFNAYNFSSNSSFLMFLLENFSMNEAMRIFTMKKVAEEVGNNGLKKLFRGKLSENLIKKTFEQISTKNISSKDTHTTDIAKIWHEIDIQLSIFNPITKENYLAEFSKNDD